MITPKTPSFQSFNIFGVEHISPENALEELDKGLAIFVDVREESEFMIEFISLNDVFNFPMSAIMDNLKNIPDDKPIIVFCQGGVRSTKVANMLNRNGFVNSVNLDGGLKTWKAKGLPFESILPLACSSCSGSCSCS
ncbi:MAG TPA: rhodanese-like domain-containing protein [Bacteroidales bacterium]|nr:rhodanese-like domain-containing protein [Bacteroidales bacterium]HOK74924.1 rhodanese-like domain-containing protein [Bacteroidales bacterium]HOM39508.1 rhodanese-like domain-containing protein [Bacteroidales bacterium]HOU30766.1 rhodanese-like domain-containing protein [Bacteroidales bacterium]HPP91890.1 rhodanese-like domain-containing protein [Bacteroidales bacterium]